MFSSNTSAVSADANYIEDVFSTWLYTGNGYPTSNTQSINNGIDLATKGGLVWIKARDSGNSNTVFDTARGATNLIYTNLTSAQSTVTNTLTSFNANGFSLGTDATIGSVNDSTDIYTSWTFRKQPKFFDVVTWTGDGTAGRTVAHSLGSVPGCIIVKQTSASGQGWAVYHRSEGQGRALLLNDTAASFLASGYWNSTAPTSTVFSLGSSATVNGNGATYVAYLFAHDAGGFGLTGTDNVISCGSFTTNAGGVATAPINLGYEPQWVMIKQSSGGGGDWRISDVMRGASQTNSVSLWANLSDAEVNYSGMQIVTPTATGFNAQSLNGLETYIYIAIRRGPMKTPTTGTSVYNAIVRAGTGTATSVTGVGFPPDLMISHSTNVSSNNVAANDRLRGAPQTVTTNTTNAEFTSSTLLSLDQNGFSVSSVASGPYNSSGETNVSWNFRRAPGFFDVVCYTGNGSTQNVTHNLGATPEMMLVKARNTSSYNWQVYHSATGNTKALCLNLDIAAFTSFGQWDSTTPTSSVFTVGSAPTNNGGSTYVAYLFASCPGVSKVGSYTGTGSTLQIDCGFTGGARFVLIKRTDSTGDWYVWDSARGIVSGNDPYLLLNSTAAEVTNTDYVDTYSAGFEISSTAPAAINANGGTFVFLAVA